MSVATRSSLPVLRPYLPATLPLAATPVHFSCTITRRSRQHFGKEVGCVPLGIVSYMGVPGCRLRLRVA